MILAFRSNLYSPSIYPLQFLRIYIKLNTKFECFLYVVRIFLIELSFMLASYNISNVSIGMKCCKKIISIIRKILTGLTKKKKRKYFPIKLMKVKNQNKKILIEFPRCLYLISFFFITIKCDNFPYRYTNKNKYEMWSKQ